MKEPNWDSCNEKELWEYVATHLAKRGIATILVGGAVVAIYSDGAYKSGDLDFVFETMFNKQLPEILQEIGFIKKDGRHFKHPECKHLFIEFQNPPVGIGDDTSIKPDEKKVDGVVIKIFSPTDCVRDRLAAYIHFNNREGLEQALLIARKNPVDLKKIQKWCANEGAKREYEEFLNELNLFDKI